ncbi:MAG: hypothetical protein C4B59_12215 [Candidatus Methanogaster sp.]|uniref:Uncharacterized protein n=1 Tax=Candidatus Methanogaster sp. TaxID=3386292 RepID=A0AC61L0B0_9EURY|nr:MAG: hypothetical protein C4B59_12215 [ANME-2 cluster archaeon]
MFGLSVTILINVIWFGIQTDLTPVYVVKISLPFLRLRLVPKIRRITHDLRQNRIIRRAARNQSLQAGYMYMTASLNRTLLQRNGSYTQLWV